MAKALDMPAAAIRCIHAEGSGCYGHNAADDVALDAACWRAPRGATGARAMDARRRIHVGAYGPAMVMRAGAGSDGRIVDWNYDVWSNNPHHAAGRSRRRQSAGELVSGKTEAAGSAAHGGAARGGGDRNAIPLYDLPRQRITNHMIKGCAAVSALRTLGAYANVFRDRIVHGRAGGGSAGRSGCVPPRASKDRAPRR